MNEKQINWCNCGRQYQEHWRINEELHRYTPAAQLEREAGRK